MKSRHEMRTIDQEIDSELAASDPKWSVAHAIRVGGVQWVTSIYMYIYTGNFSIISKICEIYICWSAPSAPLYGNPIVKKYIYAGNAFSISNHFQKIYIC